jgi:hypothetical protein
MKSDTENGNSPELRTIYEPCEKRVAKAQDNSEWVAEVKGLAILIKTTSDDLRDKYFQLCKLIRKSQPSPQFLTETLKSCDWRDERISEIKTVCFCSDEVWSDYEKRFLGFKLALQKARGEKLASLAKETRNLHLFFASFDRLFARRKQLPKHFYESNDRALCMWAKGEIPEKGKEFELDHYRVRVELKTTQIHTKNAAKKKVKK